ncbi:HAD family hydrolase [Streptomyces beijiangensis]|uniref:HAD family hydrolase n=1 Tax=Streptomyces beijiangensis TaxID=163361 RepID=A0A939FEL1_9ACTN|nr:HAD family hydrolase [Streptomyces beijiangensis]MBO0516899.1 HAD family hydrolase [Streptomyces beijiangensis]
MAIRAVLWDVDDTIFDYTSADRAGMLQHLTAEGLAGGFTSVDQALARWRELTELHWARFAAGEAGFQGQRRDRVRGFTGAVLSDEEADAWFDRYIVHFEAAWSLFPDTVPALDLLAADYRHAVLSNSAAHHQERKLRILGVRDRFELLLCAAELGVSKPEPGAFHAACDALALEPHEVLYVGDQPDIDATGAAAAGLAAVWLDRQDVGGRPELIRITGLGQLPDLLRGNTRFGAPSTFR